jgi:uncharacterized protein YoxC
MTAGDISSLIISLATLVTAVGGVIIGLRNTRRIEEVHKATNGMHAELMQVTGDAKYAEGVSHGEEHPRVHRRPPTE